MSEIRDSFDRTLSATALRPRFVDTGRLSITVDTSGYCQARCTSCPWPNMEKRNAVMSLERFNVLLGRVRGFHIEEFGFNIINEPFVDRTISSKISALAESGLIVDNVFFSSNWLIPSEAGIAQFVEAVALLCASPNIGTIRINATISGIDDETYDIQQGGRDLKDVVAPYRELSFVKARNNVCLLARLLAEKVSNKPINLRVKSYGDAFSQAEMSSFWTRTLSEQGVPRDFVRKQVIIKANENFVSFAGLQANAVEMPFQESRRCVSGWLDDRLALGPKGEVGLCCFDGLRDIETISLIDNDWNALFADRKFQEQLAITRGLVAPPADHPCQRCEFFQTPDRGFVV